MITEEDYLIMQNLESLIACRSILRDLIEEDGVYQVGNVRHHIRRAISCYEKQIKDE